MSKAIVPAAYGQQPMPTRHDARFQEVVTFGAHAAERWMATPGPLSLRRDVARQAPGGRA